VKRVSSRRRTSSSPSHWASKAQKTLRQKRLGCYDGHVNQAPGDSLITLLPAFDDHLPCSLLHPASSPSQTPSSIISASVTPSPTVHLDDVHPPHSNRNRLTQFLARSISRHSRHLHWLKSPPPSHSNPLFAPSSQSSISAITSSSSFVFPRYD
jgi:hypothetical protein